MSLTDDLATEISDVLSDDAGPWRQFIYDHITYIRQNSKVVFPDAGYMNRYRYDVRWYLQTCGRPISMDWIFLIVNDMKSEFDFDRSRVYYLPTQELINALRSSYITTNSVV